jgi:hypothetical protein
MKKIAYFLTLGLTALFLSSCCGLGNCGGGGKVSSKASASCSSCGSIYFATSGCCDTVGKSTIRRATAQNGTGEPHLGTIPTMKVLAP